MTEQLKQLWHLAFGDDLSFIDLFFRTGFAPDRCQYLMEKGQVTAALYWLDCEFRGQKQAYIYAVATHPDHRGKGLCRRLMEDTHQVLRRQNYTASLLRPGEEGLRAMYEKLGYRNCTHVREFSCSAGDPVPLRKIGADEYAALRRRYLPGEGLLQEGESISYLAGFCGLYAGEDFLLAGSGNGTEFLCTELLGNTGAAPGILAALGYETGTFRCPGLDAPFAMGLPLTEDAVLPGYLGLAFD